MIDGADVLVVSFAAPLLAREWALTPEMLGLAFSAGLLGMTFGALLLAPISDLAGRKTIIAVALTIVAAAMAASGWARSMGDLLVLRFVAGLGIGSMLASISTLASEYAPPRSRTLAVTLATAGYPLGATLTGVAANAILPEYGWRGLFLAAGAASAVLIPVTLALLPESIQFLLARQPRGALPRANRLLAAQGLAPMDSLPASQWRGMRRPPVGRLFAPDLRGPTLLAWATFFATFVTLYFLTSWLPKIVTGAGFPLASAIYAGAAFNLGAFGGLVLLGMLAQRVRLTRMIGLAFLAAGALMIGFAVWLPGGIWFFALLFLMGMFVQGGFGGLYAVAAALYPAGARTTGVGWALGIGRVGAITGPILGGIVIGAGVSLPTSFAIFSVPILLAGLLVRSIRLPSV